MMRRALSNVVLVLSLVGAALLLAQDNSSSLELTATTANVSNAPEQVRFQVLRWSTTEERDRLMAAWEGRVTPGRGAAKGGDKAGKAKGRGPAPESGAAPSTPESQLAKALQETTTVGYLWTSEIAGYALRYAGKFAAADGSQRVILITQRRLGAMNQRWDPATGTPNDHEFTVIELRLNAKNEGEGRASIVGKVTPDAAAKIISLENYTASPVVFRDVRPAAGGKSK